MTAAGTGSAGPPGAASAHLPAGPPGVAATTMPGSRPGPAPAAPGPPAATGGSGQQARMVVCAPLLPEARAVRPGIGDGGDVRVTGYGPVRSRRQAARLREDAFGSLAVAGVGGGLAGDLSLGDLVVATEVSDGTTVTYCPSAPLLAGEMLRAGLPVRSGPVLSVDRLVHGRDRERLAAGGALVADMESAWLVAGAGDRPVAVVRAISDTPRYPLRSPAVLTGGLRALRSLRAAGLTVSAEGPAHERHFTCAAVVDGEQRGVGEGRSKKAAEQEAAREALVKIERENP